LDAQIRPLFVAGECGYVAFLRGSADAVFSLEDALVAAGVETIVPDWNNRSRKAALHQDLADFGVSLPRGGKQLGISGEAFLFGVLYVLEGARLGAQQLLCELSAHPSPRVRTATRYLDHGAGRRFWPSFLTYLESSDAVRRAPEKAVAGARTAFAVFATSHANACRPSGGNSHA
jgi:heme oxygenase